MRRNSARALVALVLAVVAGTAQAGATTTAPIDHYLSDTGDGGNAAYNAGEQIITSANAARLAPAWDEAETAYYGTFVAPAVAGGVAYHALNAANANDSALIAATSVTTGKTLWTVAVPGGELLLRGQSLAGNLLLVPFDGYRQSGGVLAVDITTHRLVWSTKQPLSGIDGDDGSTAGPLVVNGARAYLNAGSGTVTAFRVSDGKILWHRTPAHPYENASGIAAGGGNLFTASSNGLTAYNGATGAQLWRAPVEGTVPVVAGGRVYMAQHYKVTAMNAAGCGQAICNPLWTTTFDDVDTSAYDMAIGGVGTSTLFVTQWLENRTGRIVRMSTSTGAVQWKAPLDFAPGSPVRAGSMVWLISNGQALEGFSAYATSTKPLRFIQEPDDAQGIVQGIAAANGTVLVQSWPRHLIGYRVPA